MKNEFSWSASRGDLFLNCQRKYYFNYYGSWNGWLRDSDPRVQEIYRLKKVFSRHMWLGSAVHSAIEEELKRQRGSGQHWGFEKAHENWLQRMRTEFRNSREGAGAIKNGRLFEHEYEVEVSDDEWKALIEQGTVCLKNFYDSEIYKKALGLSPDQWLEIEDLSSFKIDDVKVWVVLDFSFKDDNMIYLYDWKTGKSGGEANHLQLACYRLYACEKWQVNPEQVEAIEYRLFKNELVEHHLDGIPMDQALQDIRASILTMQSKLTNITQNAANEDDFGFTENEATCNTCNYKKVCPKWV